ncbi:MAG: hypothetical protein AAF997_22375 [Myxococcota bacterium]
MKRNDTCALVLCGMLAATGCGDSEPPGTSALEPLSLAPRFAVVSSDFSSSSIGVFDADFEPLAESWINSGTSFPGLVAALSGDVVLPNRQAGDGTLAFLDRLGTDVASRFFVPSGNLDGQVRTQGEIGDVGFSSNPQDFVFVDETSAWVTRFGVNQDPDASPENQGTDLLEIDPSTMMRTGATIDLSSLNTTITVMTDDGPSEETVYARPNRAVLVGTTLIVGLDRLTLDFVAGPGLFAVVDLLTQDVEGIPLPDGLVNCGNATPVPDSPNSVVIACLGPTRSEEPEVRAGAGVVLLTVDGTEATIGTTWRASTVPTSGIAVNHLVVIDEDRVAGVDWGDFDTGAGDVLWVTTLSSGDQFAVHESSGAFNIGISAYDPSGQAIFVPDAADDANAVFEYAIESDAATEIRTIEIAPSLGLPPRRAYYLE